MTQNKKPAAQAEIPEPDPLDPKCTDEELDQSTAAIVDAAMSEAADPEPAGMAVVTTSDGGDVTAVEPPKNLVDKIGLRLQQLVGGGQILIPPDYSVENALKSAWLVLQETRNMTGQPVLQACTPLSISNALLDMVVQGLHPGRKQCYFIAYGSSLACQRSYHGDAALIKRIYAGMGYPNATVTAAVIYAGDVFEYATVGGRQVVTKHEQKLENISLDLSKINGAYCVVESGGDLPPVTVLRTKEQIVQAWRRSKRWKPGVDYSDKPVDKQPFHVTEPDAACKRTVIRRAATEIVNTASDSYLAMAVQRQEVLAVEAEMAAEAEAHANGALVGLEGDPGVENQRLIEDASVTTIETTATPAAVATAREAGF